MKSLLALLLTLPLLLPAQFFRKDGQVAKPAANPNAKEVTLDGSQQWVDTGIDLGAGDVVKLTGSGAIKLANAQLENGPEGGKRAWTDMIRTLPVNDANRGAIVGRIGDRDTARAFLVGAQREQRAGLAGRLFVGINMTGTDRATGSFKVIIERTAAAAANTAPVTITDKLTQAQLDSIPRRVQGDDGTPGDRTNFIVIGSEQQVKNALDHAGWSVVDRSKRDAVLRSAMSILTKGAYVTLPMSELMLFGRAQDYGYAQGDPLKVVAARHHFRIWKAPFEVGGQEVWVGAGTHDIGFDRDQRNGKVTHKIDPDTDKERDYIARSFQEEGSVVLLEYMTATDPIKEANTAHGEAFHSDGRHAVLYMKPDKLDRISTFSDLFCSVLKQNNPDGGDWGSCAQWIEEPGKDNLPLPKIPGADKYRVVVVPGFFSSCFPEAPAYVEAWEYMQKNFGYQVDVFGVPNDSSEDNAAKIAAYLKAEAAKDSRQFIVLGYSKGAPDLQVMLANFPELRPRVAAFLSVAGASGGSRLADAAPAIAERYMNQFQISKACQGDVSQGFRSLQRRVRMDFLARNPNPYVPTYSLPAIADKSNLSKALANAAPVIAAFDRDHDGQLTRGDAIVPGSKLLGAARSDHFALALPFEKAKNSQFGAMMDKNHYPRAALLEAMVRLVVADLK
ncbi:MAG: LssY C-terminal domain-containing protein [Bryobacteraceae bacterium]|nr:LssY C-terminal domain-containing protein [Bryobacteraceae bacterium]